MTYTDFNTNGKPVERVTVRDRMSAFKARYCWQQVRFGAAVVLAIIAYVALLWAAN